jgi:glycosyltransferase involved in cell wall biosynthesis
MPLNFQVSLVIPILNEAESLPKLLHLLKAQSHRPDEIIFSDAGSTDGSPALIKSWWHREGWESCHCRVLLRQGAMPGAGRNAGVRAARNNWIVFLDGGIYPASNWLEQLCQYAQVTGQPAVFGVCHFSAKLPFAKAVCALSYGHGTFHPVIPASLFARRVFADIGEFPEHLRAGEDLVWMTALHRRYGVRQVCNTAQVSYTHFPTSFRQAFRKWRVTELHCVLAGVRIRQQTAYLFGLPALYALSFGGGRFGIAVFVSYLLLRGVIDPTRRSLDQPWWGHDRVAALIALPLVALLDFAKWLGIVQGKGVRLVTWMGFAKKQNVDH